VDTNSSPLLSAAIALAAQLSPSEQKQLSLYLLQRLAEAPEGVNDLVLADKVPTNPLGLNSGAAGWIQEKRVVKERDNGVIDIYIEYWFNCEIWSSKEAAWKHKSCYVCQHPEGRSPSPSAARKIDLLNRQIANQRPYWETMQLLNKQHKLQQWRANL
jgi:hypothetical protein